MKILCQKCKNKSAVFYYEQNVNGKKSECALCADCAAEWKKSHHIDDDPFGTGTAAPLSSGIDALFGSLFGGGVPSSYRGKQCPLCRSTFDDLRRSGKVGCATCYETFENELRPTLRSIHGTQTHAGHAPHGIAAKDSRKKKLEGLRAALEKAITAEEFEDAARLRDEIRAIEKEQ